jgi:RimJ/RimL family protein N-acetyltransferase
MTSTLGAPIPTHPSSREREYAVLVAELHALEQDIQAARATATRAASGKSADGHLAAGRVPRGEHVRLADGAEIVVRPIEPGDLPALDLGFHRLGALSRLRRFREPLDRLSRAQLTYLTQVDHDSHEAFVAFDAARGELIGVARYVREPQEPTRAEIAFAVVDTWQDRGVGRVLVERLAGRARAAGIDRFNAVMLVGNDAARRLLAHVADEVSARRDGGIVEVTARLRETAG